MRQRTPSEIKAYGDGYAEAYKEFCHLLDRHDKDKAIRKMKIFADAVALTVETATDELQSVTYNPTSVNNIWEKPTNPYIPNEQTDCPKSCPSIDICTKDDTDCAWK